MSLLSILSFTNLGYMAHARGHAPVDADLSGKTIVITGATGGLGREAARGLASLGARTVVVGRSQAKLDETTSEIPGTVGYRADLSLFSEIESLAHRLLKEEERIDVLINNVGVLLPEREVTSEGIEKTLATDLAGHFLLTNLLVPRLIDCAPSRVINVTSGGMYSERIRPDDLESAHREYKGAAAYAHAKRGQVILTELWDRRLRAAGIAFSAMHPGWARTEGVETSLPTFNRLMGPLLRSPQQGADTIIWLATADEPASTPGELWFDRRIVPKHLVDRTRETDTDRTALWSALVELTGSDLSVAEGAQS